MNLENTMLSGWKKPGTKDHVLHDSICIKYPKWAKLLGQKVD